MIAASPSRSGVLSVRSPANGEPVGEVPISTREDVVAAVTRARAAQKDWAARTLAERCAVLRRVRARYLERIDAVVELVCRENGKPRPEVLLHDGLPVLQNITYFTDHAERILEPQPIPMSLTLNRSSYLHFVPRGVIAVIGPWNFPVNLTFCSVAMALIAGNGVVVKPSEYTPLSANLVRDIFVEGGVPADLVQVVQGYGDVGTALIEAGVDMVEFTGSVATGRKVGALCGERLIPCVLELGGKAPALVLADAPLPRTVEAVLWGGYANAGQACASVERLLVHEAIYDRFVPALVARVKSLRVGDPSREEVDVGPLVTERQREVVERLVDDAVARGARVLTGGRRIDRPGYFFEPTVLADCTPEMDIFNQEIFGPVVPILKCSDDAQMVAEANRSHLGLMAYVFTRDTERGRRLAEQIESGTVMVNDVLATQAMPETPWGGAKASGIGVTHSDDGLRHLCQQRHVNYDLTPWLTKEVWWFPYRAADYPRLRKGLGVLFARGLDRLRRLVG